MNLEDTIEKYISNIYNDDLHRYKSWDNCFAAFDTSKQAESHVLELAFYLASWGMYRGSSGILQKNHLVHKGSVDIILSEQGQKLRCHAGREVNHYDILAILFIQKQLSNYYQGIPYYKDGKEKLITSTDTLISKVMLGTLGCVPAYDRYFILGLKEIGKKESKFNAASLTELFGFIDENKEELNQAQDYIKSKTQMHYPLMKILDMYFWQIGYDKEQEEEEKKRKKQKKDATIH